MVIGDRIPVVMKPSRSDEVLDPHHQLLIADQIRSRFESLNPKRPTKPDRSDPDSSLPPAPEHDGAIPEFDKLQSLRSQAQPAIPNGGQNLIEEEFVETSYYDELISIDKQHHTTGTGFIRAVREEDDDQNDYDLPKNLENGGVKVVALGLRGNPAMNDWTPNFEDDQAYVSTKPIRSG